MNPQQTVALIGMNFVDINIRRQTNVPVKHAVIDLHRYGLERATFATGRFRHFAYSPDRQVSGPNSEIDFGFIHPSKLDTDLDTLLATVGIDRRLPGSGGKVRKARSGKLRGYIVQCPVQPT